MAGLDRFIAEMPAEQDGDLMLCRGHGVAYQRDRDHVIEYGPDYWAKCCSYDGQEIGDRLNEGRLEFVETYLGSNRLLDVGIGSGQFITRRPNTYGRDVNPIAVAWLKNTGKWADRLDVFAGFTMFDVIEHLPEPESYLKHIQLHGYLFASIPVFDSLDNIRQSKHYRPGEHLQHWTVEGFVDWMDMHGFLLLEQSDFESRAGRESILSFAFRRYRWPR